MRIFMPFIVLVLFLVSSDAYAQSINQTDSLGKKHGFWKYYGKEKKDSKLCDDCLVEEGFYEHGKKTGEWKSYHSNGKIKSVVEFKNNRPQGKYRKYYDNGQLEEDGIFIRVHHLDTFKRYHPNGKMMELKFFNTNGKNDGDIYRWYENGKLELKYRVVNGVEDGKLERYYPNGELQEKRYYVNGWAVADSVEWHNLKSKQNVDSTSFNHPVPAKDLKYNKLYDKNGNLIWEGEFYNGKIYNGKKYIYNDKNEIQRIESYRDGLYVGDVPLEIKSDGNKSNNTGLNVKDGYPGRVPNDSKRLEQDGEFKDGKLWNGKWYRYDKNGLLIKIEIYKEGKYVGDAKLD